MNQERMLTLAARCVAEAIKRTGYVEYAIFTLKDKNTDITLQDLTEFGWKYIILDEEKGSCGRIHFLAGFDSYDNAMNFLNNFDKDIEEKKITGRNVIITSKNYRCKYRCPKDMRRPEQPRLKNKCDEEVKKLPDYLLKEIVWHEWSSILEEFGYESVQAYHRYCLIDLEKAYNS